jgi:hypothetical protein
MMTEQFVEGDLLSAPYLEHKFVVFRNETWNKDIFRFLRNQIGMAL